MNNSVSKHEIAQTIKRIDANLKSGHIEDAVGLLDSLETARPLTLDVIHCKARVLGAAKKAREALDMLYSLTEGLYSVNPDADTLRIQIELSEQLGETLWADYARSQLAVIVGENEEYSSSFRRDEVLYSALQTTVDNPKDVDALSNLSEVFIKTQHHAASMVVLSLAAEYSGISVEEHPLYQAVSPRWANLGSICELMAMRYPVVLAMCTEEDEGCCEALAELLAISGREIHLLLPPMLEESDPRDLEELAEVTIENAEHHDNVHIYRPISLLEDGQIYCENSPSVLRHIQNITGFALFFCEKEHMDRYLSSECMRTRGQRFTPNFNTGILAATGGYIGPYTEYIKHIHRSEISAMPLFGKAGVGISVVIPTRNCAYALEHTLRTCLNQRIDNYEIVVCDNSTPGNTETEELVKRLNSPKIRYIRAPRDLVMTKNFEHAILNAKGEFIFTIGSDDGLPFHSLEVMERMLAELPDDDVIQWGRCLYVWSDFTEFGSNGQFNIPVFPSENVSIERYNSKDKMKEIFKVPGLMYTMPALYLNSGFRRRYINRLLDKSGEIIDGAAPDIYTGVKNLALNSTIPLVNTPLVIPGICGNSNGARYTIGSKDINRIVNDMFSSNIGHSVPGSPEELIPVTNVDVTMLIGAFLRTVAMGINPAFTTDLISWGDIFCHCAQNTLKTNIKFDLYMRQFTYSAYRHSNSFGQWFEREVLPYVYAPHKDVEPTSLDKSFACGFTGGRLVLDSERFGVSNIYEACELFDKIFKL